MISCILTFIGIALTVFGIKMVQAGYEIEAVALMTIVCFLFCNAEILQLRANIYDALDELARRIVYSRKDK